MHRNIFPKLKEALFSVMPITMLVFVLSFFPVFGFTANERITFLIASIMLIVGIALFNHGAETAMTPMGRHVGLGLTKSGNVMFLIIVCFVLGTFITIAEPDLQILASKVGNLVGGELILKLVVGVSVGLFIVFAILKIVLKRDLSLYLIFFYMLLFAVSTLVAVCDNKAFLPLAFDSGGVTTGPITVPFIMALGIGIANSLGGRDSKDNSFGFVSLCSVGAVIGVLILSVFANGTVDYVQESYDLSGNIASWFLSFVPSAVKEVSISLGMVVLFFLICQVAFLRLPMSKLLQLFIGILFTYVGLVIFLTAVNAGFMPIGYKLGSTVANLSPTLLTVLGFVMGFLVVLAEPAVQILNEQVEQVTNGLVTKRSMLVGLTVGVGIALALALIRLIFGFSIMYYLIPGYLLSFILSFYVPPIYTAIAFDSGGVASGPLTTGFILPYAIGACLTVNGIGGIMEYAYGIVAMVALTPLITVQLLGFKAIVTKNLKRKVALKSLLMSDDEQIIEFM